MYKLIIEDDEGKTTVVPLIRDEITIGRKEGNTIRLTERNVSRRHAKLVRSNGSVFIEDLQSYNGIKVNGDKIAGRATVAEGDRIQIGDYQLALKVDRQATAPEEQRNDEKTTPFLRDADGTARAAGVDLPPTQIQHQIQGPAETHDRPARVVVVSSNFAGKEFALEKTTMVIGRTDDNDVVINHRSISRHHAQIVREGTHYHIVDLQSANGVRVNGEDYGKVELRKGDHIDLGHVRMRFIAPGEDFVFERDAEVIDVAGAGKSKGKGGLFAILAIAVLVLGGGAFLAVKFLGGKPSVPTSDIEGTVAKLSVQADQAINQLDWETAIKKCDEGLKLDAPPETLRILKDKKAKAENEQRNAVAFKKFTAAVGNKEVDTAVNVYQTIGDGSVYRDKGSGDYARMKKDFIHERITRANKLVPGHCDEAKKLLEDVFVVDEGNPEATAINTRCGSAKPSKPTPPVTSGTPHSESHGTREKPEKVVNATVTEKPEKVEKAEKPEKVEKVEKPAEKPVEKPVEKAGPDNAEVDKLLGEAQNDYINGQYAGAIDKARKANKGGNNTQAWRIIGASSCFQKDRAGAIQAYNRLGAKDRTFIQYCCNVRNGIPIP